MENIQIHTLVTDGLQTRAAMNDEVVSDYAEILRSGGKLPPVVVYRDVFTNYLADGYHRVEAARRLGRIDIEAEVRDGDRTAALRHALKANAAHGLRRSNEDKRNALQMAWDNRQALFGRDPSVRELADTTAVSRGKAHLFLKLKQKVSKMDTPETDAESPAADRRRPDTLTDRFGVPVPERLTGAFDARELKGMIRDIRQIASRIEAAQREGDYAFSRVTQSTFVTLRNAAADLRLETPWCVCRQCQGAGCRACGEIGVQTRREYDLNPSELKG